MTITELFREQADKTPANTALVCGTKTLTYSDLDRRSGQVAGFLLNEIKVTPGKYVALLVEKSEEMVVFMLGILKAGCAYLPIDTRYTPDMINNIVQEVQPEFIFTDTTHFGKLKSYRKGFLLADLEMPRVEAHSPVAAADNTGRQAYVIYTSGSTGKRKGVMISHGAICNTLLWRREYYAFTEADVTLQLPSCAFDSSVVDIFTPLISGASLVIPQENKKTDLNYFAGLLADHGITNFVITPTFYLALLRNKKDLQQNLRFVTVAGEKLTEPLVKRHFELLPGVMLVNEYGPTENAVCSTAATITGADVPITIGKPIDHVKAYVLNGELLPVAAGEQGELCLAGKGLADGYLNAADLTGEKFVEYPATGEKIYRTGDIVVPRENGDLEFIGRKDTQVKIRGYRVDLSEIEEITRHYKGLENTVARICRKEDTDRLVVFASPSTLEKNNLADFLKKNAPSYFLPDDIIILEEFPMNENGKADNKQLEKLYASADDYTEDTTAFADEVEEKLAQIWQAILKYNDVKTSDNFFENGGNSLNAIEAVTRIQKEFQLYISAPEFYYTPTIKAMAKKIRKSLVTN